MVGISSVLGSPSTSPYTLEEPAKTRRETPASRAATRSRGGPDGLADLLEVLGAPRREVVEHPDGVPLAEEPLHQVAANETGAAGDQDARVRRQHPIRSGRSSGPDDP